MFRTVSILIIVLSATIAAVSQATTPTPSPTPDQMGSMPGMDMSPKASPTPTPDMSSMPGMKMHGMSSGINMQMSSTVNIGDPMSREASGTSWSPDSSPIFAKVTSSNDNDAMTMIMGVGFLRYTGIGSSRNASVGGKGGRSRVDAPTMFGLMESVALGSKAQFGIHVMLSLDPVIEQGYGYPLLYQSGEEFRGQPIHDRQHPHDLFSELAVTYSYKFNEKRSLYIYAGYPGEPALGPPMYLHRVSGMNIPDAPPIGHHWQDATHITFGVVTAGYSFGKAKVEASAFSGREPDSNRWNFDRPRLDSFSGRFSFNPTKNLALQISHGYLKSPELSEPDVRILRRTTASAMYYKAVEDFSIAHTIIWGQNHENGKSSNSFLYEGNLGIKQNAFFARYEIVKKSGRELVLDPPLAGGEYLLNVLKLGYIRDIVQGKGIDVGLGGMFTLDHNPQTLASVYGGTTHGGWEIFMRFRPSRMH